MIARQPFQERAFASFALQRAMVRNLRTTFEGANRRRPERRGLGAGEWTMKIGDQPVRGYFAMTLVREGQQLQNSR